MTKPLRLHAAINTMRQAHGIADGQTCGDCSKLFQVGSRPHPRTISGTIIVWTCRAYVREHDRRDRWAKSWPACGLFQAGEA